MRRLLDVTYNGPLRAKASGSERYLAYRLGLEAGLRASEIRSLTKSRFDFRAQPATVTVDAAYSKRRRQDTLPLRSDLAEALAVHLAHKLPLAPALVIPKSDKTAEMLRADLDAARSQWLDEASTDDERAECEASTFLAYRDDADRVADFHALRHTFITNLANSGVHPKVAQLLARHSSITLTMDRYTHSMWEQLGDALERLPDLSTHDSQTSRATGTAGANVAPDSVAFCVAQMGTESVNSVRSGAMNGHHEAATGLGVKPLELSEKADETKRMGRDSNPRMPSDISSFQDCRLRPLGHPSDGC